MAGREARRNDLCYYSLRKNIGFSANSKADDT